MKTLLKMSFCLMAACCIVSCADTDEKEDVGSPILIDFDNSYSINRCEILPISPVISGDKDAEYKWTISTNPDSLIGDSKDLNFIALNAGSYEVSLTVTKPGRTESKTTTITVKDAVYRSSIDTIMEYRPAPGPGMNEIVYDYDNEVMRGFSYLMSDVNTRCKESDMDLTLPLGCFGGYIVVGFDHTIVNVPGKIDIQVKANGGDEYEAIGVVMVAYDKNKNGKPDDDEWYEIEGSEHGKATTYNEYNITYHTPTYEIIESEDVEEDEEGYGELKEIIKWEDNRDKEGSIVTTLYTKNESHFPSWINNNMTFSGRLIHLPEDPAGLNWHGYAGISHMSFQGTSINFDSAIDKSGNKVKIPGVDFIKIYVATQRKVDDDSGYRQFVMDQIFDMHLTTSKEVEAKSKAQAVRKLQFQRSLR